MRDQPGDGASMLCRDETRRGGPPQSIDLGPDHYTRSLTRASSSLTLSRDANALPSPAIVLPIQYTPLNVSRPVSLQRHFLQFFQWMPDESANPSSWTLTWALSEVVGDEWLLVTYEASLAVVNGPGRPDARDTGNFVRLRVNANGEAEFSITGGNRPRTEVIPGKASQ